MTLIRPSENDLVDHLSFIREAVKRDETLGKSNVCLAILGVVDIYYMHRIRCKCELNFGCKRVDH